MATMKITKILSTTMLFWGASSLANAASVFGLVSTNSPPTGPTEFLFHWNGNPSNGVDVFTLSSPDSTWEIRLNTQPRKNSPTTGIAVMPIHNSNPNSIVNTLNLLKQDGSSNDKILQWTVSHTATGSGHYDRFTFSYLEVTLNTASGTAIGARLRLTAEHVTAAPVPIPAAVWLFGTGLMMLAGLGKWRREKSVHDPSG